MRYLPFLILFLSGVSFAAIDAEKYAWEDAQGNVHVTYYIPGSADTVSDVLKANGFDGSSVVKIETGNVTNENVKNLKFLGSEVVIDTQKKQDEEKEKQDLEDEKKAILSKLKITEEEFEKLNVAK